MNTAGPDNFHKTGYTEVIYSSSAQASFLNFYTQILTYRSFWNASPAPSVSVKIHDLKLLIFSFNFPTFYLYYFIFSISEAFIQNSVLRQTVTEESMAKREM